MTDLSKRARELLATADNGDSPSAAQKERLRAAVLARVGAVAVGASVGVATAKAASGGPLAGGASAIVKASSLGLLAKSAAVVVIAALGTTAAYTTLSPLRTGGGAASSPVATRSLVATSSPAPLSVHMAPPPASPTALYPPPSPAALTTATRATPAPRAPPASTARSSAPDSESFPAETADLGAALNLLRQGDAQEALRLLEGQDTRYGDGALREERAVTRIDALCALGRTGDATSAAATFLRDHPRSLLAPRVAVPCGAERSPR